ncbi:CHAP domain-containing protein [Tamaricihabitans halophyticus]|nr:CHAP domain-containing protein [Tamaricihabitans halophyticus]
MARAVAATGIASVLAMAPLALSTTAIAEPAPAAGTEQVRIADAADGTIDGAIEWFESKDGDTSYEGLCEKAVENAWGTTGIWPSAIAHWQNEKDSGNAHEGDTNPPRGAFVFWNTSQYGHVGIADGEGGFYSTSVNGAIGHGDDLSYFSNYLGWSEGKVPGS